MQKDKELFDVSFELATKGIFYFIVIIAIFVAFYLFEAGLFDLVGLSTALPSGAAYSGAVGLMTAISTAVSAFLLGLYVSTLYEAVKYIRTGKNVDYMNSLKQGYIKMVSRRNTTLSIIGLGFIAGLTSGTITVFAVPLGASLLGSTAIIFIVGIFFAVISGVSISGYSDTRYCTDFPTLYGYVNSSSPNSGVFLYIATLFPILPFIGSLQILLLPLAISIVSCTDTHVKEKTNLKTKTK